MPWTGCNMYWLLAVHRMTARTGLPSCAWLQVVLAHAKQITYL